MLGWLADWVAVLGVVSFSFLAESTQSSATVLLGDAGVIDTVGSTSWRGVFLKGANTTEGFLVIDLLDSSSSFGTSTSLSLFSIDELAFVGEDGFVHGGEG